MQAEIDIRRYSDVLVRKLGKRAPAHAAVRAEKMLEAGELGLYETWKAIVQSVNDRLVAAQRRQPESRIARMVGLGRPGAGSSRSH